ncbi:MAG: hypothetical protein H0U57_06015 [Tatlockia sp.]|nr:hypothetical protein [Tatlockia sp.]
MPKTIATQFSQAFQDAGGITVLSFSYFIRFAAVMCLIIAMMWTLSLFLSAEQKETEGFMERLASRAARLVIAFVITMAVLTT